MKRVRCFCVATLIAAMTACGSAPETEPRGPQPVREPLPPLGPRDKPAPTAGAAPLAADCQAFAAQLVAAWRSDPTPVAVLPALSPDPRFARGTQVFATGAGDWLAEQVIAALRASDVSELEVWAPDAVVGEVSRCNRSLGDIRLSGDVPALLAQTDAGYAVFGTLERETVGGRLSGKSVVRVQMTAVHLDSSRAVASLQRDLDDPALVRELTARSEVVSRVAIGQRAPAFTPSLDTELAILGSRAATRLAGAHRALLAGKRVQVVAGDARADAGRRLVGVARGAVATRLRSALPGRDAIALVESGDADVSVRVSLERGSDRFALVLNAQARAVADQPSVRLTLDPRFSDELARAFP